MTALYVLIALQVLDVLTTMVALSNPKLREGNPILAKLFNTFGPAPVLVVTKVALLGVIWYLLPNIYIEAIWGLCAFYVWIVVNNIKKIRQH